MDILVISDTHGKRDRLARLMKQTRADIVFFLGDGLGDLDLLPDGLAVRAVRGNCDFFRADGIPERRIEEVCGHRFFLTHGHRYGVKYSLDAAIAAAAAEGADALLYGHTHIPFEKTLAAGAEVGGVRLERPMLVLCPGSLGEGEPSFATLTLRGGAMLAGFGRL